MYIITKTTQGISTIPRCAYLSGVGYICTCIEKEIDGWWFMTRAGLLYVFTNLSFAHCKHKQHIIVSDQPSIGFYARHPTRLPITLVKLYRSPRARQHVLPRAGFCLSTPPWRARMPPAPARVAIMPPFFPRPLMARPRAVPCGRSHQPTWSRGSKVYKRSQRGHAPPCGM